MGWIMQGGDNIYQQDKDNSCGPASVVTLIRLMENRIRDGSYVRSAFGDAEGGTNMTKEGVRDFDYKASAGDIVNTVLNKYTSTSWRSVFNAAYLKKYMDMAQDQEPAIVHISWTHAHVGGGWNDISAHGYGHWVVLARTNGANYELLDPGGVKQTVPVPNHSHYMTNYGQGWMYGDIDGILTSR